MRSQESRGKTPVSGVDREAVRIQKEKEAENEKEREKILEKQVEDELFSTIVHLSAGELRNRLKVVEVDRRRLKARIVAQKERILVLEEELAESRKECDELVKQGNKAESAKAALLRKDTLLKVTKASISTHYVLCNDGFILCVQCHL
jgi:chromosome segregation ATPase